jgi:hypothetical protein
MSSSVKIQPTAQAGLRDFLIYAVCLVILLGVLFPDCFKPGIALFSNDGPLGPISADNASFPGLFSGYWADLNWLGGAQPSATPNITAALLFLGGPVGYSKFFVPLAVFVLGLAAWLFFRQSGFGPMVCLLGGLAAALNSDFFSYACWGLGSLTLTVGATFLALAALVTPSSKGWVKAALAGLAIGLALSEGYDNGAIFSLYVAAFVVFQYLNDPAGNKPLSAKLTKGVSMTALVAIFAAFMAAQTLMTLVETQLKGGQGGPSSQATQQSKDEKWEWATGWSFPKAEILRILIPGLYGYRMDTPGGGQYWGSMGQEMAWERYYASPGSGQTPPYERQARHSGSGPYAGVLVVLLAVWTVCQSFRKKDPIYTKAEGNFIRFWCVTAVVSLLFAFGRYAPFYNLVYALPYFSTIRIPAKFLHPFHVSLIVLFGYGLHGLSRHYLSKITVRSPASPGQFKQWWKTAVAFDKKWVLGSAAFLAISLLGGLVYAGSQRQVIQHLQGPGYPNSNGSQSGYDLEIATATAQFSLAEVGWFLFFLALAVFLVNALLTGALSGPRAKWAGFLLGALLVVDLSRANAPWIKSYDYQKKYATNPVLEMLRQKPYEQRVIAERHVTTSFLRAGLLAPQLVPFFQNLLQIYQIEWVQHHFQYYNIQSLDVIQMPRSAEDTTAYQTTLGGNPLRLWELTNTRYLLGLTNLVEPLNAHLDPQKRRFRLHTAFDFYQENQDGPVLVRTNTGPYGVLEFTGALPRAKLYAHWEVSTNRPAALARLADPLFDPAQTVIVTSDLQAPLPAATTNQSAGSVEFAHYSPKWIQLKAKAEAPSVLLLNDKFDPNWHVTVDGRPETVLKCNFMMRGVFLPPGEHQVEFRFQPSITPLYVSLAAWMAAFGLCGLLVFTREEGRP